MKITCQECQSKFTVADDKVVRTVVKIRCKKCGVTMLVNGANGTTTTERASLPDDAPALSMSELADAPPSGVGPKSDAKATASEPLKDVPKPTDSKAELAAASSRAARREGGRDQGKDLFSTAAIAGSETEGEKPEKLTGERNESSVLFSLKSLTNEEKAPEPPKSDRTSAKSDGSGLIDIRALAGKKSDQPASRGVDDILSLGGGGAFGPTLSAPDLSAPTGEAQTAASGATPESKNNRGLIYAILGSAGFLGVVIVAAIVLTRPSEAPRTPTTDTSGALALNDPPKTSGTPTPPTPPTPDTPTTAKPPGQLPSSIPVSSHVGGPTPSVKKPDGPPDPPPVAPAAPPKPLSLEEELRKKAGTTAQPVKTAEAPTGGTFDRVAAQSALGGVNVVGCKKPDGPTGSGHVTVTFEASGNVQSAIVDGGDYPGTPVGGCIAGKFRGAHVPPFSGSPVKVGKSFTL